MQMLCSDAQTLATSFIFHFPPLFFASTEREQEFFKMSSEKSLGISSKFYLGEEGTKWPSECSSTTLLFYFIGVCVCADVTVTYCISWLLPHLFFESFCLPSHHFTRLAFLVLSYSIFTFLYYLCIQLFLCCYYRLFLFSILLFSSFLFLFCSSHLVSSCLFSIHNFFRL